MKNKLILAPNAEVDIQDGGNVKGSIYSKKFEMEGGGSVTYDAPFVIDGPISPSAIDYDWPSQGQDSSGDDTINREGELSISISNLREIN